MEIYQRLKDLRTDQEKTQKDIAELLNITYQQYQLYESGKRELPMHLFVKLAKYYNVSLDYLAGLTPTVKNLYTVQPTKSNQEEANVMKWYHAHPELHDFIQKIIKEK